MQIVNGKPVPSYPGEGQAVKADPPAIEVVAEEWLICCEIIEGFLKDIGAGESDAQRERCAASLLARFAANKPPIVFNFMGE